MKKLIFLLLTVFLSNNVYSQGFTVENYEVDVYINQDGSFDVVENYDLHFTQRKHGIYRNIQTHYDLQNYKGEMETRDIDISDIEVPGRQFEATPKFLRKLEGAVILKIGDPDKFISGKQQYEIKYQVKNAFLFEPTMTRFYWNLKPSQWPAPFQKIKFRIHLPEGMSIDLQDCHVYSGFTGNTEDSSDFELAFDDGVLTGTSIAGFKSYTGDAVTVLLNLPSGSIKEIKPLWPFWNKNGWMIIVGLLVGGFYMLFRKYGKDDPVTTAISYYPPENMDPAMAGFLINDREDTSDLISLIPYWGARGHLKMAEIEKTGWLAKNDTKITKLKDLPSDAPNYQKKIFNGLFSGSATEVLLSTLKDSFYSKMSSAKTQLKIAAQPYYEPRSKAVKKKTGCLLAIIAVLLFPFIFYFWGIVATVIVTLCCVVLLILNIFMIKKNTRGNAVLSELKGFKQFIKTAEENKLKMLLSETPLYFESTMAYALTFGFFEDWVKKFNNLNVQPPEWYSGIGGSHSSMNNFSKSFSSTMSSASSTMVSSPSSSSSSGGGGSSGGGFGGGGGGSW